jgi:transcription termination/antitermination protein NusG
LTDHVAGREALGAGEETTTPTKGDSGMASSETATKQWFVVHTYSGFENKVAEAIQSRAKIFGMADRITRVLVPTEKVVEVRNKQKRETEQKFFPGYVLVEMDLTDDTWHLVRSTPKVTGFVGSGAKPLALPPEQVDDILHQMEAGADKPKPKSVFQKGDKVRVIDGPFVNFQGIVDDINPERGRMRVTVPVFGRPTPVELEYYQVERL